MGDYMTPGEQKHIDEKFENLKEFFTEKINNLKDTIDSFSCTTKDQQVQISIVHSIANENKLNIKELEGDINTIKEVKRAENGIKAKGLKTWHFVLGLCVPFLLNTGISILIYFLITKP
jgi:GTP:adenosylcobinamide-phosphate guanylyltransferase